VDECAGNSPLRTPILLVAEASYLPCAASGIGSRPKRMIIESEWFVSYP